MKKLCYIATIPAVVHAFLRPHIQAAAGKYQITVICNAADKHLLDGIDARIVFLPITRKPSLWNDVSVGLHLAVLFRREHFDIVHSIMPKTGMLAMFAAWLAGVPVRMHTFTGQVWATKRGTSRIFFRLLDKLIANFATCALADSPSQREFLIGEHVLTRRKAKVIGAGSICGVDTARFHPDDATRRTLRRDLAIAADAQVILFVGRLNRDKGMLDLAQAFHALNKNNSNVELLLVGDEEDVSFAQIQQICASARHKLHHVKFTPTPEHYMAAADIFCLPSYREGFGLTIIEAAACGLPAVASRIYGITDAVVDGDTGVLFEAGNVGQLTLALQKLLTDAMLCQAMGERARARASKDFSSASITSAMVALYDELSCNTQPKNYG